MLCKNRKKLLESYKAYLFEQNPNLQETLHQISFLKLLNINLKSIGNNSYNILM